MDTQIEARKKYDGWSFVILMGNIAATPPADAEPFKTYEGALRAGKRWAHKIGGMAELIFIDFLDEWYWEWWLPSRTKKAIVISTYGSKSYTSKAGARRAALRYGKQLGLEER